MGPLGTPLRLLGLLLRPPMPKGVDGRVSRLRRQCFAQGGLDGRLHGGLVEGPEGAEEEVAHAHAQDVANKKLSGHGGVITILCGCGVSTRPAHAPRWPSYMGLQGQALVRHQATDETQGIFHGGHTLHAASSVQVQSPSRGCNSLQCQSAASSVQRLPDWRGCGSSI